MTNGSGDAHEGHERGSGANLPIAPSPQRVSGMKVPAGWTLPGKPADLDDVAEDAWRQTGFTCGEEMRLVAQNLDLLAGGQATLDDRAGPHRVRVAGG